MRDTATEDPVDPRDAMDLEDTDLARRNSYPAVTQRKGASDGLGLAAGIIAIGALGAVTLWALQNPDTERNAQGIGGGQPDGQVDLPKLRLRLQFGLRCRPRFLRHRLRIHADPFPNLR